MPYSIEKRLRLIGDVSNLMLVGSIHVYGTKKNRVRVTLLKEKNLRRQRTA